MGVRGCEALLLLLLLARWGGVQREGELGMGPSVYGMGDRAVCVHCG